MLGVEVNLKTELEDQGYAVIQLLNADQVASLRAAWTEIVETIPPVWDPTGMATTVRHPESDRLADDSIRRVATAPLADHLSDSRPFFSAFIAKNANSNPLPPHLDWTLLDEPTHQTFGCWIALEDIVGENGVLSVVPKSHLAVDFKRTPENPGHEWANQFIESGHSPVDLPVRAGEAVLFNHRLIHSSKPNTTKEVRVVASIGLAPIGYEDVAKAQVLEFMRQAAGAQVASS